MKHKFSLMWRVGVALVMVLSLGLMAAPVSAQEGAALTVTITEPAAGSEFAKMSDFTVKAEVKNTGVVAATDVEATIAITDNALLKEPGTETKPVAAAIPVGESGVVEWTLTCTAVGDVDITVTPTGTDSTTLNPILPANLTPATVTVSQVDIVPILTVDITEPADVSNISVGQVFTVTAVVINSGYAETTGADVTATIAITGEATPTEALTLPVIPTVLPVGGSGVVSWTLTCNDVGDVTIKVTPAGEYGDPAAPTPIPADTNLFSDDIALTAQLPAALEVTGITAPGTVKVGAEFDVTAAVKNTGGAMATDVKASVAVGTTAGYEGEIIGSQVFEGDVTVFSDTLENVPVVAGSLVIAPEANIETTEIDWEKGAITVTYSLAPPEGDITAAYTSFTGDETLAKVVSDIPVKLGTLAGDAETQATFTLRGLLVGDVVVRVNLTGDDANTEEAGILGVNLQPLSATVAQKEAAVLTVITLTKSGDTSAIGEEFTVTATVENTGAATAQDVALTLSIDANAALAEDEVATESVGYLAPKATSVVEWTLVSTTVGKSTITVTPSGIDVLTDVAILAGSLKEASVTVLQSITEIINLPISEGWNLISLPLIPTDPSIGEILDGVDGTVNKVAYYTGGPDGDWLSYSPPAPGNLTTMNDGKGYWIDVSGTPTFTAYGVELALPGESPPTYDVVVGWNLIGFTGTTATTGGPVEYLGPAIAGTDGTLEAIYGFSTGLYSVPTQLDPGKGYWLAVNAAGKIYP